MVFFYYIVLLILSIYSFVLVDPNITLFQSKIWETFRDQVVYLGYYRRDLSWLIYLFLIIGLFIFNSHFIKRYKQFNPVKIAILIAIILFFSYPFLSHDFFNYMFDAKILTFYHQNPYFYKALDFPNDQWLRFMHWTHRTYPYGPIFLLITLIPSFLSFGKFILSFLFFKLTFVLFYLGAVYLLQKMNRRAAIIFATNPVVIIEGLVNSHNDLIGVSLALIGIYHLLNKKGIKARLFFALSVGIKYITFPILFLMRAHEKSHKFSFLLIVGVLLYISLKIEIQPWYFLTLFIFLPFFTEAINKLNIFFFGLLISYYPYIRLGGWDTNEKIIIKHWIIISALILNIIFFLVQIRKHDEKKKFS